MDGFKIHTTASAPAETRPLLTEVQDARGFLPNLLGQLAESPAALNAYAGIARALRASTLGPAERELVLVAAAAENDCHYCTPAHSWAASQTGLPSDVLQTVRAGRRVDDVRLEALRALAVGLVRSRGWVADAEVQRFLEAGFTRGEVLDVIALVAMKTLSTYANHIAETPLDPAYVEHAFNPRARAA